MPRPAPVAWKSPDLLAFLRHILQEAGEDPRQVPDEPFRLVRMRELTQRTGLTEREIYRRIKRKEFPRPIPIGGAPAAPLAAA